MANRILTIVGWQGRIRDKLGVDSAYLPDSVIEQPECIDIAEQHIIDQAPNYASLENADRIYLEAAVVCEAAALLCPGMKARLPIMTKGPHESHELNIDWDNRKKDLEIERDNYLGEFVVFETVNHFYLAGPNH